MPPGVILCLNFVDYFIYPCFLVREYTNPREPRPRTTKAAWIWPFFLLHLFFTKKVVEMNNYIQWAFVYITFSYLIFPSRVKRMNGVIRTTCREVQKVLSVYQHMPTPSSSLDLASVEKISEKQLFVFFSTGCVTNLDDFSSVTFGHFWSKFHFKSAGAIGKIA